MGGRADRVVEISVVILLGLGGAAVAVAYHVETSRSAWFLAASLGFGLAVFVPFVYYAVHPLFAVLAGWREGFLERQRRARVELLQGSRQSRRSRTAPTPGTAMGLVIQGALYGPVEGGGGADVAALVTEKVANGRLDLRVSNEELGGDPFPGKPKHLILIYAHDGTQRRVIVQEESEVHIP